VAEENKERNSLTGIAAGAPADAEGVRPTIMVAAFEGWNDAAEAASGAVRMLAKSWGARKVGRLSEDDY
jgi:hypothetical protein